MKPAANVRRATARVAASPPRATQHSPSTPELDLRTFARWPQLKLEIVRRYASAYSRIMSRQAGLAYYYIEAFSGAGVDLGELNGEPVAGSPLNALRVEPPFRHHYLLDLDGGRAAALRRHSGERADVTLLEGNGNELLLRDVLPRVRAEDYRRALCVLDPCGTRLDWRVVEAAGRLRTIDLFVCLPAVDERGGPLWRSAGARATEALERVWGDDGWREVAPDAIATAFARRLREVGRFENVLAPLPIRDGAGDAVTSHLFFASRTDTANHVIEEIFAPYRASDAAATIR